MANNTKGIMQNNSPMETENTAAKSLKIADGAFLTPFVAFMSVTFRRCAYEIKKD